jgi:hypothetical protein
MALAILSILVGILCFLGSVDELSAGWSRPASFGVGLIGVPVSVLVMLCGVAIATRWTYVREIVPLAAAGMLGLAIFGGLMQQVLGALSTMLCIVLPVALLARYGRGGGPTAVPETDKANGAEGKQRPSHMLEELRSFPV